MDYELKKDSELISVIVCTYNQQDTIGRTLDSILSQQCHLPIEIVIGEDGSDDDTLSVCLTYQQQHPEVIRILANQPRKGFVRNYFDCLRACRGKYIADCSGDDFWTDASKLEDESLILEQNPSIGIVHTDWQRFDVKTGEMKPLSNFCPPSLTLPNCSAANGQLPKGERTAKGFKVSPRGDLEGAILMPRERPAIHLCTSLYRADWIRQAMERYPRFFDPEAYRCEDIQIAFFMARMGDVAYIDRPTLAYSWGGNSVSNPDSEEKQFHFWANTTELSYELANTFLIKDPRLEGFFQSRLHKLLMHAFRSGKSSLRTEALRIQQVLRIKDNRQTLQSKILLLPIIWPIMRRVRNFIKEKKTTPASS